MMPRPNDATDRTRYLTIEDLPQDLWNLIVRDLDFEDSKSLCVCSKKLYKKMCDPSIWKTQSYNHFLSYELTEDILSLHGPESFDERLQQVQKDNNWHNFFVSRVSSESILCDYLFDCSLRHTVHETYWNCLKNVPDRNISHGFLINTLKQFIEEEFNKMSRGMFSHFDSIKLAQDMAQSIRHQQLFSYIKKQLEKTTATTVRDILEDRQDNEYVDSEELLLLMSTMDPAFENLLPYRKRMYKMLNRAMDSIFERTSNKFIPFTILAAAEKLFSIFDTSPSNGHLESLMLPRVYAHEAPAHPDLLFSILQKICMDRGYLTRMGFGCLIFDWRSERYYYISSGDNITLETESSLRTRPFNNTTEVQQEPLSALAIMHRFYEQFFLHRTSSFWHERDRRLSDQENIMLRYRVSKGPIPDGNVEHFRKSFSRALLIKEFVADSSQDNQAIINSCLQDISDSTMKLFPMDLAYVKDLTGFEPPQYKLKYDEWLSRRYPLSISNFKEGSDLIGKFMLTRDDRLGCIAGVTRVMGSDDLHITLFDSMGDYIVDGLSFLKSFEWDEDVIAEFLETSIPRGTVGLIFHSIDWEKRKLGLNLRALRAIASRGGL
ncbi:SCF ubiquitin ligase complex subunit MDM30 KNAG_0A06490 [Huiozyma naganishii CBS 8797]|uniref:F-box domain-containing protein n=1 Tax=Huiozyma naganishii (strain ATCC MYA-139 / BCRC 22969 / CBS 8797 / KCTC 17520 / NBRC 10181 / NCYC 3082 / Yp74L-3) TaxID=1071383 RepID=J7RU24_HUIN7|nr:hypothetical protein KNAG_0A06490 [Kazachstania naganishii CBS 8797]CCK68307.1 hypothetical protein KNAG_0A06490 [Kazachstania naganishii CBS 8797]